MLSVSIFPHAANSAELLQSVRPAVLVVRMREDSLRLLKTDASLRQPLWSRTRCRLKPLPVPLSFGEEPPEFVLHSELGRPPAEIGEVEQLALG